MNGELHGETVGFVEVKGKILDRKEAPMQYKLQNDQYVR